MRNSLYKQAILSNIAAGAVRLPDDFHRECAVAAIDQALAASDGAADPTVDSRP